MAWHNESRRHSLASKGIKTSINNKPLDKIPISRGSPIIERAMKGGLLYDLGDKITISTEEPIYINGERVDGISGILNSRNGNIVELMTDDGKTINIEVAFLKAPKGFEKLTSKEMQDLSLNDRQLAKERMKGTPIYQGEEVIGTVEDKKNLWSELKQFYGTQNYYKGYMGVKETDGVHYLGAKAGWLVSDAEVIVKAHPKVRNIDFVTIKVKSKDNKASVTYLDRQGKKVYTQRYSYAEIPDGEKKLYYTDGVLMLAGEN